MAVASKPVRDKPYHYDRHLNSPLSVNERDFYYNFPFARKREFPNWPDSAFRPLNGGIVDNTNVFQWVEEKIKRSNPKASTTSVAKYQRALKIAVESMNVQADVLFNKFDGFVDTKFDNIHTLVKNHPKIRGSVGPKVQVLKIHEDITTKADLMTDSFTLDDCPWAEFNGAMVLIKGFPGGDLVISYNMFLGVLDKIEATFHFWLYTVAASQSPKFKSVDYYTHAEQLHEMLEKIYATMGVGANGIFKILEAICAGAVLETLDPDANDVEFLNRTLAELEVEKPRMFPHALKVANHFRKWLDSIGPLAVPAVMDCYGQEKLHFFPIIDDEAGLIKMYRYGTAYRQSQRGIADILRGLAAREFTISYYEKEKRLPPIIPLVGNDQRLLKWWKSGTLPYAKLCRLVSVDAWADLAFKKVFDFDYTTDPLDLLDDKSCAPDRSNLHQIYAPTVRKEYGMSKAPSESTRRLVQYILECPEIDIKELFRRIHECPRLPHEITLILLSMKERENKEAGRPFSILHPVLRMITSSLEKNISQSLYQYFPQQTMTSTGATLTSDVDHMAAMISTDTHAEVKFHIDLEQWNYTFREKVTIGVQNWLNELFGVKHYDLLMRPFKDAYFVSADSFNPYVRNDKFTSWTAYPGGNQGICQKFWTFITILCIVRGMTPIDLPHILRGSGDNQVLNVSIPKTSNVSECCARIKYYLEQSFGLAGLTVKVHETWHSDKLLAYQRKYYYEGQPLPQGCKTSTRFASGDNDGADSVTMHTMTAMGAGATLASNLSDPAIGPLLGLTEWYIGLLCTPRWSVHLVNHNDDLVVLSWMTASLGYLPVQPLSFFQYSGHKDLLTETLALLDGILQRYPKYRLPISRALGARMKEISDESRLQLILDIESPNIKRPVTAETFVKEEVYTYLTSSRLISNNRIREMFNLLRDKPQHDLANSILNIRPINLSVLHALFDHSEIGRVNALVNKFVKVRTLVKMTNENRLRNKKDSFEAQVRQKDKFLLKAIKSVFSRQTTVHDRAARALLCDYWSKHEKWCALHDLDPYCTLSARLSVMVISHGLGDNYLFGPYTAAPSEQLTFFKTLAGANLDQSIIVTPSRRIPLSHDYLELVRGPFSLYVGSRTQETVRTLQYLNLSGVDNKTSIQTLTKLHAWLTKCGSSDEIQSFIKGQLDLRLQGLAPLLDMVDRHAAGGNIGHRLAIPGDVMGAYLSSRSVISTHYSLSTDRALMLQRGEDDRYIFFQQLFHWIFTFLRWNEPITNLFAVEVRLDHCGYLIPDQSFNTIKPLSVPPCLITRHLRLADAVVDKVRQALEHELWVRKIVTKYSPQVVEKIAAALACQASQALRSYQRGMSGSYQPGRVMRPARNLLNLTLVRAVPTQLLLSSIVITWAYQGALGRMMSPTQLMHRLKAIVSSPTTLQEMQAYAPLLEALSTTGKIPDLAIMTNSVPKWVKADANHSHLDLLFRAVLVVTINIIGGEQVAPFAFVLSDARVDRRRLHRFLLGWSKEYRMWSNIRTGASPLEFLALPDSGSMCVQPIPVVSAEELIEKARSKDVQLGIAPPISYETLTQMVRPQDVEIVGFQPWARHSGGEGDYPSIKPSVARLADLIEPTTSKIPKDAFQMARWASNSSGGRLKLIEIFQLTNIHVPDDPDIVALAEGAASMLSAFLHIYPNAEGLYNSLIDPEELAPSMSVKFVPPELSCKCGVVERVLNVPYIDEDYGDLDRRGPWERLKDQMTTRLSNNVIITWDREGRRESMEDGLSHLIQFASNQQVKVVIVKLWASTDEGILRALYRELSRSFPKCEFIKPFVSNPRSEEFFGIWGKESSLDGLITEDTFISWVTKLPKHLDHQTPTVFLTGLDNALTWLSHFLPCSVRDPFTFDSEEGSEKGPTAGLIQVTRLLRHIIRSRDTAVTGLARSFQHMTDAETQGTQRTLEVIRSILIAISCIEAGQGHNRPESDGTQILGRIIRANPNWLDICEQSISQLSSQTRRDMTWRMLGSVFGRSQVFPSPGLKPVLFQMMHQINKLKATKYIGKILEGVNSISQPSWENLEDGPDQTYYSLFSFQVGRAWANEQLRDMVKMYGEIVSRVEIYPEWLRDVWYTHEWPVTESISGTWEIYVGDLQYMQLDRVARSTTAILLTWTPKNCDHNAPSRWSTLNCLDCPNGYLWSLIHR